MSSTPKRTKKRARPQAESIPKKKTRTAPKKRVQNPTKYKSQKKKKKKKNWLSNFLISLLFLVALALIFNVQIRNFLIKQNSQAYAIDKVDRQDIEANAQKDVSFDFGAVESLSTEAVIKAQFQNKNLPVIGGIAIPEIKINLPIFKGLDNVVLLTGAGTMKPEQEMGKGNYALASHRVQDMVSLFSPLEYAKVGQFIYVTDLQTVYTYKITSVEKVEPSRVDLIEEIPDKKMITLITCGDMNATTRIAVQGELESTVPMDQANQNIVDAFNMQQLTL